MKKAILATAAGCWLATVAVGQTIDLRGVVKDKAGFGIAGAVVKLMSNGLQATTDAQGKFMIQSASGLIQSLTSTVASDPVFLQGKGIQFGQTWSGPVHLQVFDLSGKIKSDLWAQLGAGTWLLNPGDLKAGIFVGRLESSNGLQSFRFSVFHSQATGTSPTLPSNLGWVAGRMAAATVVDSLQAQKSTYTTAVLKISSLVDSTLVITLDTAAIPTNSSLPGDIAMAAGTPLVAAHSMIRAMYKAYGGKLFQVRRNSDGKTQDILPTTAGGAADATALKAFCPTSGSCTIPMLYDQSGNANDLPQASVSNQMVLQYWASPSGSQVPMAVTISSQYLRNRISTHKIPVGAAAQTLYFVVYTKVYNAKCCWDYGNMELVAKVSSTNTSGKMSALNIGTSDNGYANPGAGSGPWGMVDYEAGVYSGSYRIGAVNPNNPSLTWPIATVLTKSNGTTSWALKVGDVSKGTLTTSWNGALPPASGGVAYNPLHQEGGLSLGEGGDGSKLGTGAFFEGVVVANVTSDATDNGIQAGLTNVFK